METNKVYIVEIDEEYWDVLYPNKYLLIKNDIKNAKAKKRD